MLSESMQGLIEETATELVNRIKELCEQLGIPSKLSDVDIPEQAIPAWWKRR